MEQKTGKRDVYAMITKHVIKQLELGTIPWRKSWIDAGMPQNLISKKPYRGINAWMLASLGYERNLFLTFQQANEIGGYIKKGEKSHIVVYTKRKAEEPGIQATQGGSEESRAKQNTTLHYYHVFNIAQCLDIQNDKIPELVQPTSPLENCKVIVRNMPKYPPLKISHARHETCYDFEHDRITIPRIELFENSLAYYSALFHELAHSTGHSGRLNWKELMRSKWAGPELHFVGELIAEIAACHLNSFAGIPAKDCTYNVAYLQDWIKQMKHNKGFIFSVSAMAQKAVDYILNVQRDQGQAIPNK